MDKMHPFRAGIGLLAANLDIPALPMRIDGLFEFKKAGKKFAPPWKITVRIGEPMSFAPRHEAGGNRRAIGAGGEVVVMCNFRATVRGKANKENVYAPVQERRFQRRESVHRKPGL